MQLEMPLTWIHDLELRDAGGGITDSGAMVVQPPSHVPPPPAGGAGGVLGGVPGGEPGDEPGGGDTDPKPRFTSRLMLLLFLMSNINGLKHTANP